MFNSGIMRAVKHYSFYESVDEKKPPKMMSPRRHFNLSRNYYLLFLLFFAFAANKI